jgi:hypothetical protein
MKEVLEAFLSMSNGYFKKSHSEKLCGNDFCSFSFLVGLGFELRAFPKQSRNSTA